MEGRQPRDFLKAKPLLIPGVGGGSNFDGGMRRDPPLPCVQGSMRRGLTKKIKSHVSNALRSIQPEIVALV